LYSINTHDKSEDKKDEIIGSNMEEGMVNLKLNVIIAKNMVIMLGSVEAVLTMLKRKPIILKTRKQSPLCCHLIMEKKGERRTRGILITRQATICVETKTSLWSLMNQ
jgi:hypothetical protein